MVVRTSKDVSYRCTYSVVWCTKYLRKVLFEPIDGRLRGIIAEVVAEKGAWLIEAKIMPDHVHLLVEVDPYLGVHRLVKAAKGRSSRLLRHEFPSLRSRLPTLWTNSYFVASVGAPLTDAAIARYVEAQKGRGPARGVAAG